VEHSQASEKFRVVLDQNLFQCEAGADKTRQILLRAHMRKATDVFSGLNCLVVVPLETDVEEMVNIQTRNG
jgi:hypothetical protein